ncbi:g6444 [Coccomyxa viridis]|uniref:G6444 protein n=1 Tax=Coccomyxa viridis TaxID=1274662 RepID=A0ABP1G1Y1_9CHLO
MSSAAASVGRYRTEAEGDACYEYLDHTADIQIHSWGRDLGEAMANAGLAMYNYMTPLSGISIEPSCSREIEAEGHDEESLLFAFLDELLFIFHTEFLVCKRITVTELDRSSWSLKAHGEGQMFERGKHASGTEVKAITYSNMQIREQTGDAEIFVIVDI